MGKNLIIKGADFSENAIPEKCVVSGALIVGTNGKTANFRNQTLRSTVVLGGIHYTNTKWEYDTTSDFANKGNYALNEIPVNATKVKVTYPSNIISICIFDRNYTALITPSWSSSDGIQEINLSNFPKAWYFSLNTQNANANIDNINIEFV